MPPYLAPGASTSREAVASLPVMAACASVRMSEKLAPNFHSTIRVIRPAPAMSSTALMICTQVVPFMPPMSTYTIISAPTTAITTA